MIKEQDILEAIAECQGERNPNANTCRNLAAFYTILDHIRDTKEPEVENYSYSLGPTLIEYNSETEFSNVLHGRDVNEILPVIDELMTTLHIINPRLYEGVMRKLQ